MNIEHYYLRKSNIDLCDEKFYDFLNLIKYQ